MAFGYPPPSVPVSVTVRHQLRNPDRCVTWTVTDDGLADDGIREGDLLAVEIGPTHAPGCAVLVKVAGVPLVRRLKLKAGKPFLVAENRQTGFAPLAVEDPAVEIVGVVVLRLEMTARQAGLRPWPG